MGCSENVGFFSAVDKETAEGERFSMGGPLEMFENCTANLLHFTCSASQP